MKLLKRDFVPCGTVSVKNYPLTSGKAYFIKDGEKIVYASTDYVKDKFSDVERKNVVDLTRGLIRNNTHNGGGGGNNGEIEINKELNREKLAITYLLLIQEKMLNFSGYRDKINNSFLSNVYDFYKQNNFISEKQINAILNVELKNCDVKNKHNCKVLSLKNLQTCYAYEYKIKRAIEELPSVNQEYMINVLNYLYKYFYLTDNQIDAIRKWFEYLPDDLKNTKLKQFDK